MRFRPFLVVFTICLGPVVPALADAPISLHVAPQTSLSAALADLAKQSGTTILADSTVTAQVGPADYRAGNVGEMLTKLQALDAGLTWRKVYLPANAPVPTADVLSRQVHALEAISATGLVVASPTDVLSFTHRTDNPAAPAGMQAVYLVTDETARAQSAQSAVTAPAAAAPTSPVDQATSGMKNVANVFGQLTPDQQQAALPLMFQQFQRIVQAMDPAVRAGLGQMMQQMQNNGPDAGNGQ